MLKNMESGKLAEAIRQSYEMMDATSAERFAAKMILVIDEELEPAVEAWVEGKQVPDIAIGKYSVRKILAIRNGSDYLEAFHLLSEYKADETVGERKIWTPKRIRRQRRQ